MIRARIGVALLIIIILFSISTIINMMPHPAPSSDVITPDGQIRTAMHLEKLQGVSFPLEAGKPPATMEQLKGKIVLIDFWATWCNPCRVTMPILNDVYKKYKDRGLTVIGVSTDDPKDAALAKQMHDELKLEYPSFMKTDIPNVEEAFPITNLPTVYIYNKAGAFIGRFEGAGQNFDRIVSNILEAEKKPAETQKPKAEPKSKTL